MAIITLRDVGLQAKSWQWHLQNAIRSPLALAKTLGIESELQSIDVDSSFPLLVPMPYLQRIVPGDLTDPLLRQVLPIAAERVVHQGFSADPLQEVTFTQKSATSALIQKYHGRILIITTGACAVNCRYCFRRHFPYGDSAPGHSDWLPVIKEIAADPAITEVILSGGDPLILNDARLAELSRLIGAIPHVQTLRIHTRLPIVIPQRICDDLISWVSASTLKVVFVTHINHANEIDDPVSAAIGKLSAAGVTLLNQSVLLRGVNDSSSALIDLSIRLFEIGILPYYLHLLDPVSGAAHFDVPEDEALTLMKSISARLSGYLVPRLVREVPGAEAKQLLYRSA